MGAIVLQFVFNDSFGSDVIRWFDHGAFSHVDTVLPDGSLLGARNDVIDGIPAGVQIRPATYVDSTKAKRVTLSTTTAVEMDYYNFVHAQIGKPYDQTAIMAFLAGRNWMEQDSWFCSELCAAGLVISKFLLHKPSSPCNKIAPDDLLLICSTFVDV